MINIMEELRALFSPKCAEDISKQKCKILAENYHDAVALEKSSVSAYSPKLVADCEIVARQIFSPIHIDTEDNSIKSAAFDDVSNKGLSVNRLDLVKAEAIHAAGNLKAEFDNKKAIAAKKPEKANRAYLGYAAANVADIRNYFDEDCRVYTVYDNSLEQAIAHADVCMIKQDTIEPGNIKWVKLARRKKLQEFFSSLVLPKTV